MFRRTPKRAHYGNDASRAPRRRRAPFGRRLTGTSLSRPSLHLEPMEERRMLTVNPFVPDALENNDIQSQATILGSPTTATVNDLTTHNPSDVDWLKYTAHDSGLLHVNLFNKTNANIDVFFLIDDSGSFIGLGNQIEAALPGLISSLTVAFPGSSLGFGVGRLEDYANFEGSNSTSRPFILQQPILNTTHPQFNAAVNAALGRTPPGNGGDTEETVIEALFQTATGVGFDGNNDGDTSDSGAAGLINTQQSPGGSGDVPAFSTFTPDAGGPVVAGPGTLGGVGWRTDSLKLVIIATDNGFRFEPDGFDEYVGLGGVTVPASEVTNDGEGDTPGDRGAAIQQTINALNEQGIQVIGIGDNDNGNDAPKGPLQALATLTGALNNSPNQLASGTPGDPILPGEPLYFNFDSGDPTNLQQSLFNAISAAAAPLQLQIVDSNGNVLATGTDSEVLPGLEMLSTTIPVVSQQEYFVRVNSPGSYATIYDLEIENFAAPVPQGVVMDPATDSGWSHFDNLTNDTTPTFVINADLGSFADAGISILSAAQLNTLDPPPGVGVAWLITELDGSVLAQGFADLVVNTDVSEFAFTPAIPLADGDYLVRARVIVVDGQEDGGGNPDPAQGITLLSQETLFTIDTTDPTWSSIEVLNAVSVGPNLYTNVSQITLEGTATALAIVRFYSDGDLVGEGYVGDDESDGSPGNGLGVFTVTLAPLVDGTPDLTIEVEDAAGNLDGEDEVFPNLIIDTLAPQRPTIDLIVADDTGFANDDDLTRLTTLTFRISAEAGSDVVIKDGNTVIETINNIVLVDGFATVTIDFDLVETNFNIPAEGPHPLSIESTDTAGNRSAQSAVLPLVIDETAPTWTSIEVLNVVVAGPDLYTNINEVTLEGRASALAIVRFYSDSDLVGEGYVGDDDSDGIPNDGFGVFTVTLAPLLDGTPDLTIQVESRAGVLDSEDEVFPNLIVDTLAPQRPTIDLIADDDTGFANDDDYTKLTTLTFRISAEAGSDVVIKDGNTVIETINNIVLGLDGFATVTIDFTTFPNNPATGAHPLSIESTDTAGNRSAQSAVLPLVINPDEPNWSTIEVLNTVVDGPNLYTKINEITLEGTATALALVRFYSDGDLVGEGYVGDDDSDGIPNNGFGVFTVTLAPLLDGTPDLTIQVESRAGVLDGEDEVFPNLIIDTLPPQRPTIDLITPDDTGSFDNDDITNLNPPVLEFRISAEAGSDVVIKDGNTVIVTLNNIVLDPDGFATVTIDFTTFPNNPAEGPHPLSIESTDTAGNRSAQSAVLPLVIDLTDPILGDPAIFVLASSVTDICLEDDVVQTSVDEPAFSGYVEALAIVRLYARNVDDPFSVPELIGIGQAGSDESDGNPTDGYGIWEITVEPLADGNYEITMQVEDVAGNITPWPDPEGDGLFISIDTLAPQRPTIDLLDVDDTGSSDLDNVTNLGILDFRISAEPGSHVLVKDGEVVILEIDNFSPGPDGFLIVTIDFFANEFNFFISAEGPHPLSVEAFDCAGNRSAQSEQLLVTIDLTDPCPATPDMLSSSDSGMFDDDEVTNIRTPAFSGYAEANATIRIYASPVVNGIPGTPELVGIGVVGSDESDGYAYDGLGIWEVTIEPLDDGEYVITTEVEDLAGNIGYCVEDDEEQPPVGIASEGEGEWEGECELCELCEPLTIYVDTLVPNTPYLDLVASSDTGRHNADEVTFDVTPTMTITADDLPGNTSIDPNALVNPFWHDVKWRLFARKGDSPEVLVASLNSLSELGYFVETIDMPSFYGTDPGDVDGVYSFKLEVEDRAGNISPDFLLTVTFDTIAPIPSGDLHPNSDSGVTGYTPTFGDKITNVKTPSFFGSAEANIFVDLLIDNVPAGGSVSVPLDGNFAFLLNGEFYTQSNLNLVDGLHTAIFIHEDLAGNKQAFTRLFFVDTQGPRITNVVKGQVSVDGVLDFDGVTSLFAPKPQSNVDPLIYSIVVNFLDNPPRVQQFLYEAVFAALASQPGNYTLIGDHTGYVTIVQAIPTFTTVAGLPALASVELVFAEPLPDDRFTFSVSQNLRDPAGNALDGESSAAGPFAGNPAPQDTPPFFPTGDGSPGGGFVSRFTADSRPELGTYASTTVYLDINGNAVWDLQGQNNDHVNVDLTFVFGNYTGTNDARFAGKFSPLVNGVKTPTDGFDKLGAYGNFGGTFRWLIDTDSDGVPNLNLVDAFQKDGLPVAGNFDKNKANGDEIGYFTGDTWYLDTNGDYILDTVIASALRGFPIVGDFDGDGYDDLAVYAAERFQFDFYANGGWNGAIEDTILWGFDGVVERPVAADMDADGIDDIGLWVPGRSGQFPREAAEWFFLVSGRDPIELEYGEGEGDEYEYPNGEYGGAPPAPGNADWLDHPFSPVPFGHDLSFQFGDEFAIPILGNFDPPNDPLTENFAFLPFEDTFTRADSTNLGSKWVERLGNVRITAGEMVLQGNATSIAVLNGVTATDVSVEAVVDVTNGSSVGLLARYGGPGDSNAYMGLLVKSASGYAAQIWRNVGGTWTNLTSQTVSRGQGTLQFEVVGTSLRLILDGQTVGEATDSQLSTGGAVGVRHSGGKVTSFKAETQLLPFRAAATLPFVDDFARANSTSLGANWQELEGDVGISNGSAVLYRNATSIATLADAAVADVVVSADIDITGGGNAGLLARQSGPGDSNGYMARLFRGDAFYAAQIWRNVDGNYVPLRSVPVSGGAGNLKLEVIGSELKLYFNGQLVASTIDTAITGAGTVGIRHSGGKLDNFTVDRATAPVALAASLPFADAFTRTDNSILASDWATRAGDFRIVGGKVVLGAGETSVAVVNGAVQANVSVSANIDVTAGGNTGLLARYSGPGDSNAYMGRLVASAGHYYAQIWKNVGGTWTYLTHAEVASGSGLLRFDVVGNSLKLYFDDLLVGDTLDSSITTAGQVGFRHSGGTLDNFAAE